ncbi:MAG: integrase arm-type DNA-binding domain-containing protein [Candidatus Accumulibacter sp.]|nr:integrase arm-type DNA-binding domain-containing protein [Accumulibacter sp.]
MALTDVAIRNAKPEQKPLKIVDGAGLYLLLNPNGSRWWRLDYRFAGKRKTLSMGVYPQVTLAEARERRDKARKLLANGIDPSAAKKAHKLARQERAANTFEIVAEKWFKKWKTEVTESTASSQRGRLTKHILPALGETPVSEITAPRVLVALEPLEARGTGDTLRKSKMAISQIMDFAIQHGLANYNPVPSLKGAFKAVPVKHMPAILDPVKLGKLLRDIDGYRGSPSVTAALRLLPLLFCRPGELRAAKWEDIDLEKAEWRFTASKTGTEHHVPLSRQAAVILEALHPITGHGRSGLVFPGQRPGRPLSDATLNCALRTLGYDTRSETTGHGFRATARTLLSETLSFDPLVIEHQLGHRVPDALGTAYNRTKFLPQRRVMMQAWADYLDKLQAGADVIPLRGSAA